MVNESVLNGVRKYLRALQEQARNRLRESTGTIYRQKEYGKDTDGGFQDPPGLLENIDAGGNGL